MTALLSRCSVGDGQLVMMSHKGDSVLVGGMINEISPSLIPLILCQYKLFLSNLTTYINQSLLSLTYVVYRLSNRSSKGGCRVGYGFPSFSESPETEIFTGGF